MPAVSKLNHGRDHTMKRPIILIIIITIFSCSEKPSNEISGIWDVSNLINKYASDTISITSALAGEADETTVKTDSGIMVITHFEDSVISIEPARKIPVLHFHFDDYEKGVISEYQIDFDDKVSIEDPRWTASNFNFWTLKSKERKFIVVDAHYDQFGKRLLDTSEYKLIAPNKLLFKGDTLIRINEP